VYASTRRRNLYLPLQTVYHLKKNKTVEVYRHLIKTDTSVLEITESNWYLSMDAYLIINTNNNDNDFY